MPEEKKFYLTKEGIEKVKKEHESLKTITQDFSWAFLWRISDVIE